MKRIFYPLCLVALLTGCEESPEALIEREAGIKKTSSASSGNYGGGDSDSKPFKLFLLASESPQQSYTPLPAEKIDAIEGQVAAYGLYLAKKLGAPDAMAKEFERRQLVHVESSLKLPSTTNEFENRRNEPEIQKVVTQNAKLAERIKSVAVVFYQSGDLNYDFTAKAFKPKKVDGQKTFDMAPGKFRSINSFVIYTLAKPLSFEFPLDEKKAEEFTTKGGWIEIVGEVQSLDTTNPKWARPVILPTMLRFVTEDGVLATIKPQFSIVTSTTSPTPPLSIKSAQSPPSDEAKMAASTPKQSEVTVALKPVQLLPTSHQEAPHEPKSIHTDLVPAISKAPTTEDDIQVPSSILSTEAKDVVSEASAKEMVALLKSAQAAFQTGDLKKAYTDAEKAKRINPNFAAPWTMQGHCLVKAGDFKEAIKAYTAALETSDPTLPPENRIALQKLIKKLKSM